MSWWHDALGALVIKSIPLHRRGPSCAQHRGARLKPVGFSAGSRAGRAGAIPLGRKGGNTPPRNGRNSPSNCALPGWSGAVAGTLGAVPASGGAEGGLAGAASCRLVSRADSIIQRRKAILSGLPCNRMCAAACHQVGTGAGYQGWISGVCRAGCHEWDLVAARSHIGSARSGSNGMAGGSARATPLCAGMARIPRPVYDLQRSTVLGTFFRCRLLPIHAGVLAGSAASSRPAGVWCPSCVRSLGNGLGRPDRWRGLGYDGSAAQPDTLDRGSRGGALVCDGSQARASPAWRRTHCPFGRPFAGTDVRWPCRAVSSLPSALACRPAAMDAAGSAGLVLVEQLAHPVGSVAGPAAGGRDAAISGCVHASPDVALSLAGSEGAGRAHPTIGSEPGGIYLRQFSARVAVLQHRLVQGRPGEVTLVHRANPVRRCGL